MNWSSVYLILINGLQRLQKELQQLLREPVPHVRAFPNPSNILEWHYAITGPDDTPYKGL